MPMVAWPENLDLKKQSEEIPGSRKEGQSGVWESFMFPWDAIAREGPKTCYELFEQSVERNKNEILFTSRKLLTPANPHTTPPTPSVFSPTLKTMSYSTAQERRLALGKGLIVLEEDGRLGPKIPGTQKPDPNNTRPEKITNAGFGVGIWSINRAEWQLIDLACQAFSLVSAALYDTLGPDVVEYVVNHAPLSVVFATRDHVPTLLKLAGEGKVNCLRVIVVIDIVRDGQDIPEDAGQGSAEEKRLLRKWGEAVGVEILSFGDVEDLGRGEGVKRGIDVRKPNPETMATISYTSGTTGMPKGVLLTHKTFTSAIIQQATGGDSKLLLKPVLLSYLPLAHIYERFLELLMPQIDGTIAYTTGEPLRLLEDAQIFKPTFFCSVPRVLNRIHQAIMAQVHAGGLKGNLLDRAIKTKVENFKRDGTMTHTLYDALVFRKIRALLGGRVAYIGTGSAPLAADVNDILRACLCCEVAQGYGMTETVGTASKGIGFDPSSSGMCGVPVAGMQMKVVDVKEMGYTANDQPNPRGELMLKGPNIFSGYHKDEKNTRETLEPDGWMHTGDVAEIDSAGRIKIIDRIKNVLKLSQGEYVAVEKVEGIYALSPLFSTVLLHGDSLQSHLVFIGVLEPTVAAPFINKVLGKSLQPSEVSIIEKDLQNPKVRAAALKSLEVYADQAKLNGFERAKAIYMTVTPFPAHVMTPTLKVKRSVAAKHYKKQIDEMYNGAASAKL